MELTPSDTLFTKMTYDGLEKNEENDTEQSYMHVIVSNFEPLHFVATMGIGISAGIMYEFPILSVRRGMRYVGLIFFFANLVAICITHVLFFLKYLLFPYIYKDDARYQTTFFQLLHTPKSVFLGCSVMGGTTVVNMLYFLKPHWWVAIYTLWTINYVSAFLTACCAGFFFLTRATHMGDNDVFKTFSELTPTFFLPFVTCTVSAASGGLISNAIPHLNIVIANCIIIVMMLAIAIAISLFLFAVFLTRLLVVGIPKGPSAFTFFIPIGVLGQGSFGLMNLGAVVGNIILENNFHKILGFENLNVVDQNAQQNLLSVFAYGCKLFGIFGALCLSGFGVLFTLWSVFAVCYWYIGWPNVPDVTTGYHSRDIQESDYYITIGGKKRCLWTPTMWACTFPLGTMALSFNELWSLTHIGGFKIVATIYAFAVILTTTHCTICSLIFVFPWRKIRKIGI